MNKCELCDSRAKTYCESDQASLCWSCDAHVHAANFIVAKHSRTLLCHFCQAPTPWNASGLNLGPTVSVCHICIHSQNVTPPENDGGDVREDDDQDTTDDGFHEDDVDGNDDNQSSGGDGGDEDNQVVPLSPPPVSSSSRVAARQHAPARNPFPDQVSDFPGISECAGVKSNPKSFLLCSDLFTTSVQTKEGRTR